MSADPIGGTNPATARAVLGHGLALIQVPGSGSSLDLAWVEGASGRGLGLVEGVDNLAQDLAVALLTPLGSDPFDTEFGFDGLDVLTLALGQGLREQLLRVSIIRTLLADPRVVEVPEVVLEPIGDARRQAVHAAVRTVLGADAPMTLGEVEQA